jgi:hypothetical protein
MGTRRLFLAESPATHCPGVNAIQTKQPNKDPAIHGTEGHSLRRMPSLDVKLMTKDQYLSFQRDPRPE